MSSTRTVHLISSSTEATRVTRSSRALKPSDARGAAVSTYMSQSSSRVSGGWSLAGSLKLEVGQARKRVGAQVRGAGLSGGGGSAGQ